MREMEAVLRIRKLHDVVELHDVRRLEGLEELELVVPHLVPKFWRGQRRQVRRVRDRDADPPLLQVHLRAVQALGRQFIIAE